MSKITHLKKIVVFVSLSTALSACAEGDFSTEPLAFKQVPVESATDENFGDYTDDLSLASEVVEDHIRSMNLRDKVLRNSDIAVRALDNALRFYDANQSLIRNKKVITIFDITKHSGQRRLYVINTDTGSVRTMHVSHGQNSDRDNDGIATEFSNTNGSWQSSLGFMLTAETYYSGKNGYSLRLDGLEARNSNVRPRLVVIHGANYVNPNLAKMGRSQGCPAVSMANITSFINEIKQGSLVYTYHAGHDG